jgi:hypothetical protein
MQYNTIQYNYNYNTIQLQDNSIRYDLIEFAHDRAVALEHPFILPCSNPNHQSQKDRREAKNQEELKIHPSIYIHTFTDPAEKECPFHISSALFTVPSQRMRRSKKKPFHPAPRNYYCQSIHPSINRPIDRSIG